MGTFPCSLHWNECTKFSHTFSSFFNFPCFVRILFYRRITRKISGPLEYEWVDGGGDVNNGVGCESIIEKVGDLWCVGSCIYFLGIKDFKRFCASLEGFFLISEVQTMEGCVEVSFSSFDHLFSLQFRLNICTAVLCGLNIKWSVYVHEI